MADQRTKQLSRGVGRGQGYSVRELPDGENSSPKSEAEVAETDINCIMGKLIVFTGNSSSRAVQGEGGKGKRRH